MYDADFVRIYQDMKMKLYSYVLYKCRSQAVAEDITSDVFVKFFKEIQEKREIVGYAQAWLYRVASNLVIDHQRSSYYKQTSAETEITQKNAENTDNTGNDIEVFVSEYNDVLAELAKDEQQKMVVESMSKLKPEDQEIIELRLYQELPFKEISVILESTEAAVKMKFSRAIEKLKVICNKEK